LPQTIPSADRIGPRPEIIVQDFLPFRPYPTILFKGFQNHLPPVLPECDYGGKTTQERGKGWGGKKDLSGPNLMAERDSGRLIRQIA